MSLGVIKNPFSSQLFTVSSSRGPKLGMTAWKEKVLEVLQSANVHHSSREQESFEKDEADFEMLLRYNKDKINVPLFHRESTIFHALVKTKHPEGFVDILCQYDVDFSMQDQAYGNTPLLWAVANAHNEMAREIILHIPAWQSESLNKQCREGNSALHLIVGKGHVTKDSEGIPLTYSNYELLELAIKQGANVNLRNRQGNTPLHLAYARRDFRMIRLLIQNGADLNQVNKAGKKPKEMLQLGKDENESYNKARALMEKTVHDCFTLKENDYKNPVKLNAIRRVL